MSQARAEGAGSEPGPAERQLAAQRRVLDLIAGGAPLDATLEAVTAMVEAVLPGVPCSILLLDDSGAKLRVAAAASLPPAYNQAVEGLPVREGAGACGTAASRRELVVVEDIATDPLWRDYRDETLPHGLRACTSLPILSSRGAALGTIALYYRVPRRPAEAHLELARAAASLSCIAIERASADARKRDAVERFELISRATNDVVWDLDLANGALWWNDAYYERFGYRREETKPGLESWSDFIHPDERAAVVAEREAREGAACCWIGVRSPLALQVGLEEQALRAGLPAGRLVQEVVVGSAAAERRAQPLQRACGGEHHAHRVPGFGDGVAEGVQARLPLGAVRVERREDDAGRAEHDRERPRPRDADAERAGGLVARAPDLGRLARGRQPFAGELERLQHLLAPAPVRDVEEQRAGGVRAVDRLLAREPVADVVLRQQHPADPREGLGLVVAQPEELRRREAGQGAVASQRDQALEPDALFDLRALGGRALVVPEDRRADRVAVLVEHDEPVHLPRPADRRGLDGEVCERALRRGPPGLGVLLRPAGPRRRERVGALGPRQDLACRRERERLHSARADVDSDERGHAPSAAYTSS